jgi:hypothetical protein
LFRDQGVRDSFRKFLNDEDMLSIEIMRGKGQEGRRDSL